MSISLKTYGLGFLALLSMACVAPFAADAQTTTAQLIVVTQTIGVATPSGAYITVTGTGPSLSSTPTSQGTLTFNSSFANESRVVTMIPGSYSVTGGGASNNSFSYSSGCSGYLSQGEVRTCTVTATQGGTARVNVTLNVINNNGGTKNASDFLIVVSGQTSTVNSFQGSTGQVQITLGSGAYSIDVQTPGNYSVSRSTDCSGTVYYNETRSCLITLDDNGSYYYNQYSNQYQYPYYYGYQNYPYTSQLSCTAASQTVRLGETASFSATGVGPFNWSTADRTYLNVGPNLNVILSSVGRQAVYVSNGYQTASCQIDVVASGTVLGTSTKAPYLPNTGYAPNPLLTIAALLGAFIAFPFAMSRIVPHAKRTVAAIFS